jgi:phosphotransferase system enzyme I (PtsP)
MRPASIGPVKSLLRRVDLGAVKALIEAAAQEGQQSVRPAVVEYLRNLN